MQAEIYRVEVEGELGHTGGVAFRGMSISYDQGNTVLEGRIRDQAELHGLLQRVADLGLKLVSVRAIRAPSLN